MTLQEALDYINALRADPDSPSGDDVTIMTNLIYLSSVDLKTMLRFPFDLERKTITAAGTSTENMDADFDDIVGTVYVDSLEHTVVGIEQINELSTNERYCYLTYNKTTGLWVLNINPAPTAAVSIEFTQKVTDTKVTTTTDSLPFPEDIVLYIVYDVAARLEWQDDESSRGEELKQRRELLLKDLKRKYNHFSGKNNRYVQFDGGDGFGTIGQSNRFTTTV